MTNGKYMKNEQWLIIDLLNKITDGRISKPKFQRKKKWTVLPNKKKNIPNEKDYINFLYKVGNSVHAITFGEDAVNKRHQNVDGNNRINAICHFYKTPFDIFPEYMEKIKVEILKIDKSLLTKEEKDKLIVYFKNMDYHSIIRLTTLKKYFKSSNELNTLYENTLKNCNTEGIIEAFNEIQDKLRIGDSDARSSIKINVNLFEGYNTTELCKTFEDINKYNTKLTEVELLACRLYEITDFVINDKSLEASINKEISNYYQKKNEGEILQCYEYGCNSEEKMNAFDFIIGFQNYCHSTYTIVEKSDAVGLSLFFKLYKALYGGFESFNTEKINDFIKYIKKACNIFQSIRNKIFTSKIDEKLFNANCQKKFINLKKNNIYLLFASIIGYIKKKVDEKNIINSIEKCLLYHFLTGDLTGKELKDERDKFKLNDSIRFFPGGSYIDNMSRKLLKNPQLISEEIKASDFKQLLIFLISNSVNVINRKLENGNKKNNKRRARKFFEKCLYFYYYKEKIPTNLLEKKFSIEHICPFSSTWENQLDIDRTGNIIPIIAKLNNRRSNKHISTYNTLDPDGNFFRFIKDIIPDKDTYNSIVHHEQRPPNIINNKEYDDLCIKNENIYIDNFINCLYK